MSAVKKYVLDGGQDVLLSFLGEDLFDDAIQIRQLHKHLQEQSHRMKTTAGRDCINQASKFLYNFRIVPSDSQRHLRNIRLEINFKHFTCCPQFAQGAVLISTRRDACVIQDLLSDAEPQCGDVFVSEEHDVFVRRLLQVHADAAHVTTSHVLPAGERRRMSRLESASLCTKQRRSQSVPRSFREIPVKFQEVSWPTDDGQASFLSRQTRTTGDAPRDARARQRDYGQRPGGMTAVYKVHRFGRHVSTAGRVEGSSATFGESFDTFTVGAAAEESLEVPCESTQSFEKLLALFKRKPQKDPSNLKEFKKYCRERMQEFVDEVVRPCLVAAPVAKQFEEASMLGARCPRDALQEQHVKISDMAREHFRADHLRIALQVRGESRFSDMSAEVATALSQHMKREFNKVIRKDRVAVRQQAPTSIGFEGPEGMNHIGSLVVDGVVASIGVALKTSLVCTLEEFDKDSVPPIVPPVPTKYPIGSNLAVLGAWAEEEPQQEKMRGAARRAEAVEAMVRTGVSRARAEADVPAEEFREMVRVAQNRYPVDAWLHRARRPRYAADGLDA